MEHLLQRLYGNHTLICLQTVQMHSTTLTLTLDILKLKDGVASTVPWRTFTLILDFYALLLEL